MVQQIWFISFKNRIMTHVHLHPFLPPPPEIQLKKILIRLHITSVVISGITYRGSRNSENVKTEVLRHHKVDFFSEEQYQSLLFYKNTQISFHLKVGVTSFRIIIIKKRSEVSNLSTINYATHLAFSQL